MTAPHSTSGAVRRSEDPCCQAQSTRPYSSTAPQAVPIGRSGRSGAVEKVGGELGFVPTAPTHNRRSGRSHTDAATGNTLYRGLQ